MTGDKDITFSRGGGENVSVWELAREQEVTGNIASVRQEASLAIDGLQKGVDGVATEVSSLRDEFDTSLGDLADVVASQSKTLSETIASLATTLEKQVIIHSYTYIRLVDRSCLPCAFFI